MQKKRTFKAAFTCRWAPSDGKDGETPATTKFYFGWSSHSELQSDEAPSDIVDWSENTPPPEDGKPYLWMCIEPPTGASTYARVTGEEGAPGASGAYTSYSFNISKQRTSKNASTTPSDCAYSAWNDAPIQTTETYPYLWMRMERKNDPKDNSVSYVCMTGAKGDPGKPGNPGGEGNGISSQTTYFIATDKMKVASYSSVTGWSTTFPTATEQKPYVWKCVKTTYTKSGTTYSTPELITTYHSGDNANIIDNAAFTSAGNMTAWALQSQYQALSGKQVPSDKGAIDPTNKKDNRNSYHDTCKATGATITMKEVLRQVIHKPGTINKLAAGQWYTFSFWAKGRQKVIPINETSSSYGFAERSLYLVAGRTYNITIVGKCSQDAVNNGKELRTYIYKSDWSESAYTSTDSTIVTGIRMTFTPKKTGEYKLNSYMYNQDYPRTGTVTVYQYEITDGLDLTTFIYPTAVDTNTKMIVDGTEKAATPSDLGVSWALTNEWKRHTVTFKTKESMNSDEQAVLFRLQPTPNEEAYREVWICMPKLESGMFATGFVDGIDDLRGIPGLIERTSEWAAGVEFHNDENLTGDIRYLDLVTVTDNTTGKFELYQCRVTHTSTAANAPSDNSAEWLKLNQMRPIYTPLIVAKNAVLRFSQTNRILITNSKDKVQGCFGGVEDEANGYPLWIGAITAAAAKFRVKYGGQLEASEVSITGTINATSGTFNNVSIDSGTIGGFTISGNGLTNDKNFNNDAYIILRNDNSGAFAGIGGNLLPASSGLRAVARFENENKSRWFEYDSLGQNIAMMLSAKNADRNVALEILGGCIKGFALNTKIITNKTYTISRDENVVSYISDSNESGDWVEFTLPDMQWYDEGHFVMLSRESVGDYSFKVKPGYCYDKSGKRYETYIYNKGKRYTKSGFDTDFFSAYGSCILVYCPRWQVVSKNAVLNKGIWLAYGVM
ncbi:hypothetical protein [Segatella copri]|uniref:hypothetical protein n=1 Tax=Segatella copri TaxID=165179 RepID=UPI001290BB47|nr:hypothetical protein [Segatella copri]MQN15320.1 hypothetical protein [Segatella copri]MQN19711.1 hypothetical protein [Segatella copri]